MAVEVVAVVAGEIEIAGLEQFGHVSHALLDPFRKSFENHPSRADVTRLGQVVQSRAIAFELPEIRLKKVDMDAVEPFEVPVQELR